MAEGEGDSSGGGLSKLVTGSKLPGALRKRAVTWFKALLVTRGGQGAQMVRQLEYAKSTLEGQAAVDKIVAEAVGRELTSDPDFMERAKARFVLDVYTKQANLEAVADGAERILEAKAEAVTVDAPVVPAADEPPAEPDPDWLNSFTDHAEKAASDQIRQRWSKVLAGEIEKPGSFSPRTMRFIADLDRETAEDFQAMVPRLIGDAVYLFDELSFTPEYNLVLRLTAAGLISGHEVHRRLLLDANGVGIINGTEWGVGFKGLAGAQRDHQVIMFSRIAIELSWVVGERNERAAVLDLARRTDKSGLHSVVIGRTRVDGDRVHLLAPEQVWPEPPPPRFNLGPSPL